MISLIGGNQVPIEAMYQRGPMATSPLLHQWIPMPVDKNDAENKASLCLASTQPYVHVTHTKRRNR